MLEKRPMRCRPFSMLQLPKMDLFLTENRGLGRQGGCANPQGHLHCGVRRCMLGIHLCL